MKRMLLAVVLLFPLGAVAAVCNFNKGESTVWTDIPPINLSVARDRPVDSVIHTHAVNKADRLVKCFDLGTFNASMELVGGGREVPAGSNIFETGIPGIGLRVLWYHPEHIPNPGAFYIGVRTIRMLGRFQYKEFNSPHKFKVELVKTAATMQSGSMNKQLQVQIYYSNALVHVVNFNALQVSIANTGCKVTSNAQQQVNLPPVKQSAFTHQEAVVGGKAFTVSLLCNQGVKVAYQIDGVDSSGSYKDVLPNGSGQGMAKGVGVQLLRGDLSSNTVQLLGTRTPFRTTGTTVEGEVVDIPLAARYFQTASKVTPGHVHASATMTMTYE